MRCTLIAAIVSVTCLLYLGCLGEDTLCGNDVIDPGEVCDYGADNAWSGAECDLNCTLAIGSPVSGRVPYTLVNHTDAGPVMIYRGAYGPAAQTLDWDLNPVGDPVELFTGVLPVVGYAAPGAIFKTDGSGRLVAWWENPEGPQSTVYFFGSDFSLLAGPLLVEPTGDPGAVLNMGDLAVNRTGAGVLGLRYTLSDNSEVVYVCAVSVDAATVGNCYLATEVPETAEWRDVVAVGISDNGVGFLARSYGTDNYDNTIGIDLLTGSQLSATAEYEFSADSYCYADLHIVDDSKGLVLLSRVADVQCDDSSVYQFGDGDPGSYISYSGGGGQARFLAHPDATAVYALGLLDLDQGSYYGRTGRHIFLGGANPHAGPKMGSFRMNSITHGVIRDDSSVLLITYDDALYAKWVGPDGYYLP